MIRLLQRNKIDDDRWNSVVAASAHETIYPYTWYMDACAVKWRGYVFRDYECIMPVAFRKKYGLNYVYQPYYCQQLGAYSAKPPDSEIVRMFLQRLRKDFRVADYGFNATNLLGEEPGIDVADRTNHCLSLRSPYEKISRNYTNNCMRNVRKSYTSDLTFTDNVTVEEAVALKKLTDTTKRKAQHYMAVRQLFETLHEQQKIKAFGVRSKHGLHAAAIFAFSLKRAIYMLSASSETGKESRAMFRILDAFIQMHAGQDLVLDFEGSSISSIGRFFAGFGARPEIYQRISYSRLPRFVSKFSGHA